MNEITYAPIRAEWAEQLTAIEHSIFSSIGTDDLLSYKDIIGYCEVFPEGGFVALDGEIPQLDSELGSYLILISTTLTTPLTT